MNLSSPLPPPSAEALLAAARSVPDQRLARIELSGKAFFVKRPESHSSVRWRLQKGDPKRAFAREVGLIRAFAAKGAAVPDILAEEAECVILADHGPNLADLLGSGRADVALLHAAGVELARLHGLGLTHGRPSLRDICWDGARLTFLDLEAGAKLTATPRDQARDLYLLLHSAFVQDQPGMDAAPIVLAGYRSAAPLPQWQAARRLARQLWWLEMLAAPGKWLRQWRGKTQGCEFAAVGATRALILSA
jgi:tRNA A-37 threonylcarbamoyl transferase component Bud32